MTLTSLPPEKCFTWFHTQKEKILMNVLFFSREFFDHLARHMKKKNHLFFIFVIEQKPLPSTEIISGT